MIALLACAAIGAGPRILELPDATEDRIVIQALAPLPELGDRELAHARILAEVLSEGTDDYSAATIRRFSSMAGQRLRSTVMPDHIRVQLVVPKGQFATAVSLIDSILRRASLAEEAIVAAQKALPYRFNSYWREALDPWVAEYGRLRREDIVSLYKRAFSPDKLTIAVAGAFVPGEAQAVLAARFEGWTAPRLPSYRPSRPPKPLFSRTRSVTTIELSSQVFAANDPQFPQKLMAAIALGTGKASSAWRVWRDAMGATYRQEAVLWPDAKGFKIRLLAATLPVDEPEKLGESMRKGLIEDVDKWNFETLERTLGMAEGVLLNSIPLSPLYLGGSMPLGDSLEDRAFMAAYWLMKTGKTFDAPSLHAEMRQIPLEDLQKAARELLESSVIAVISGSK